MAGDCTADTRQYVREVPQIERLDAGNARHAELQNGQTPARTQHACEFGAGGVRTLHVADAEGNSHRINGLRGDWQPHRVAANQRDPTRLARDRYLLTSKPKHRPREINAYDTRGRWRRT